MKAWILTVLLIAFYIHADTNLIVTTNWLTASREFREVGGNLYNVEKSVKFETIIGRRQQLISGGAIFSITSIKPIYETIYPKDNSPSSYGNFSGGGGRTPYRHKIGEDETVTEKVFIKNFPSELTGRTTNRAMPDGFWEWHGERLRSYDYGLPHVVPVLVTNRAKDR